MEKRRHGAAVRRGRRKRLLGGEAHGTEAPTPFDRRSNPTTAPPGNDRRSSPPQTSDKGSAVKANVWSAADVFTSLSHHHRYHPFALTVVDAQHLPVLHVPPAPDVLGVRRSRRHRRAPVERQLLVVQVAAVLLLGKVGGKPRRMVVIFVPVRDNGVGRVLKNGVTPGGEGG